MADRELGGYRLVSQLAVGGMAEIYIAKTAGVGGFEKLVALKVIHPNYSADPEFVQMLVDEAKLAVQLQHTNIVQTFDLGRVDEQYYIAMELVDGIDLYRMLRRASEKEIDFPFEVAAFIAHEACVGIDYAHRRRDSKGRPLEIVHRDISPQNILVSFEGEVKVCDFGIAKAARRAKQTAAGVIKGKYYYMSPEQAWGEKIDSRTDIFSAGILLYEMLVGQMLYLEEDMDVLLEKVRRAAIPKPSTKRSGVPAQLETLVMKALAKRPEDRFQTAGDFSTALQRFLRARAPDFNRGKLAAFVQKVLGNDPTNRSHGVAGGADVAKADPAPAPVRDPRLSTAMRREQIVRDQNSLLFKLGELSGQPAPAVEDKKVRAPRRREQATSPVSLPELVDAAPVAHDFEDNDATIVDGGSETLLGTVRPHDEDEESTRPMGGPDLRDLMSQELVDDPALDAGPALFDEESGGTDVQPPLPGMRAPAPTPSPTSGRATRSLRAVAQPPPSREDEDDTDERLQPEEVAARAQAAAPARPQPAAPTRPQPAAPARPQPAAPTRPQPAAPTRPQPAAPARPQPAAPTRPQSAAPTGPSATDWPPIAARFDAGGAALYAPTPQPLSDPRMALHTPRRSRMVLVTLAAAGGLLAVVAALTLTPAPTRATIEIVSSPAAAEVKLDTSLLNQATPLVITDVDPARPHHVAVTKKGFEPWEHDVRFDGNLQVRLQAVLLPIVGSLDVASSPPGAEVIVNGRVRGLTPVTVADLPPTDDVTVELRLRGFRGVRKSLAWNGKRRLELSIPLEKAR